MFKSILVGIDGSEHADRAVKIAADLALHYDAELHLVHTPELATAAYAVGVGAVTIPAADFDIQKAGNDAMEAAAALAQSLDVKPASLHISNGAPAEQILNRAKAVNADLVVMGRRGLGGLGALVLGSVSQQVSKAADCAVMTVK